MASAGPVSPETVQIAEDSYDRCGHEAFFHAFYRRLLGSDETIRRKFARTDFEKQNKLLQHGLGLLFIYAKRGNPAMLERIAARHGPADVDVPPTLYPVFVDCLIATVKEFDTMCSPEVEQAWRQALAPGIAFMGAHYTKHAEQPAAGS